MLKIEEVGELMFGPDGRSIVLEYLPPYEERGQYGIERGGQILELRLAAERRATPLFEHQPGEKYWLGDASPDGRRLLVFQASRAQTRIGVFDFETKRLTLVDEAPQTNERFELNSPIWISDHEIVFSSRAENWNQYGIRERTYVTDRTSLLRRKAFSGLSSVASASTTPADRWFDGNLIRFDVESKSTSVLGRGRFGNFELSADGKKLAALRLGQRLLQYPAGPLTDYFRFSTQLYIFDLEDASSWSFLPDTHVSIGSLRWSDTGSKLSFFAWHDTAKMEEGAHYVMESESIFPVQIDNFAPTWINVVPSGALKIPVAAEWLRKKLIVHGVLGTPSRKQEAGRTSLANSSEREEAKWYAVELDTMTAEAVINGGKQSHEVLRLSDGRLLLQSDQAFVIASDSADPITLNIANGASILNGRRGDEIDHTIVFTVATVGNREIGFLDLTRNKPLSVTNAVEGPILAWAPNRREVIVRTDTEDGGTLYLQSSVKAPFAVFAFNNHMSEVDHPRWRTIEYRGADGIETFSCVLLPYSYDPEKSYPTIVHIYPGTGKACKSESGGVDEQPLGRRFWGLSIDMLSANGYLVIQPSNTYGLNQGSGTLFGGLQTQVDAALEALIDAGMTDPERIGIWGFSNGSMASLWIASVSDRYKAVVPMFGASSPYIEYFSGASPPAFQMYLGAPVVHLVQFESESGTMPLSMGRSAIADPVAYINSSPLDRASHICSPVMMVHSDLDGSFSSFHYEALFSALYRLGKQAELIRYYGEGHGLRSPENIRDFYDRVLTFFDKHVATGESPVPCDTATVQ